MDKRGRSNDDWKKPKRVDMSSVFYTDVLPLKEGSNQLTRDFLAKVLRYCVLHIEKSNDRNQKVINFQQPADLQKAFDFEVGPGPRPLETVVRDCARTLPHLVKTAHPHYFNQLSTGLDIVSLAGEWFTAAVNTNMFTYEIAPVFILMEHEVFKKMRSIIGFKNGDSMLAPGGAISNLYAVIVARSKLFPEYKKQGLKGLPQMQLFTSEQSHYSTKSAASVCGFGTDNVIQVPCDDKGKMIPAELERLVIKSKEAGNCPFFVCLTCGTTVRGAFDPIPPIADICEKYNLWLHVDAAWGGGCLMSAKHRHKLEGVERVDSITWNPHKLLGSLLECSTIHFKENGLLKASNAMRANYLYQPDKAYDVSYDTGDKAIQCGRHNDIFKFWLMWRAKGDKGFEHHIDHLFEMADYLVQSIKARPDKFILLFDNPECTNVCYWYVPKRLRDMPDSRERQLELGKVTPILKGFMLKAGTIMVSYQPLGTIPNFFRNIISNAAVKKKDIDFLLDQLDRIGQDL